MVEKYVIVEGTKRYLRPKTKPVKKKTTKTKPTKKKTTKGKKKMKGGGDNNVLKYWNHCFDYGAKKNSESNNDYYERLQLMSNARKPIFTFNKNRSFASIFSSNEINRLCYL